MKTTFELTTRDLRAALSSGALQSLADSVEETSEPRETAATAEEAPKKRRGKKAVSDPTPETPAEGVAAAEAPTAPVPPVPPEVPTTPVAPSSTSSAIPVGAAPSITVDQLGKAGGELIQAHPEKMMELMGLLQKYGVQAVTMLRPEHTDAFAVELRGLGAAI